MPLRPAPAFFVCALALTALAGCGRKGALDLPQAAAPLAPAPAAVVVEDAPPVNADPLRVTESEPVAPKGRKRKFVLDPLLD